MQPVSLEAGAMTRLSTSADLAACRALLSCGSRSFHAASFLLPPRFRAPATAVYAFCRIADDAVDCVEDDPLAQAAALVELRERLALVYAANPIDDPVDRCLSDVVRELAIPKDLLDALIEGFEWDAQGRRYDDLSGVYAYSARVAGAVGAIMTTLMGARSPDLVARACDLGVAMQLTNICRDVGEDARNGRVYLPLDWLREAGIDPHAWLRQPVFDAALASVVQRLLDAADALYQRADTGISGLSLGCRAGINAARYLYSEIGREVERRGLDSISGRAVVSPGRKITLMLPIFARTLLRASREGAAQVDAEPLDETRFLVDAVVAATPCLPDGGEKKNTGLVRMLELLALVDERQRMANMRSN